MNSVNFNVVTPNVNYARLSDESTDKPTEQVSFKAGLKPDIKTVEFLEEKSKEALEHLKNKRKHPIKYFLEKIKYKREGKKAAKRLINAIRRNNNVSNKKSLDIIDAANEQAINMLNKDRPLADQREIAMRDPVGLFFKNFGNLLKNIGKKSKEASRNQKVVDFSSDAAMYFDYKKRGRNIEAEIYKERMRKFLEE